MHQRHATIMLKVQVCDRLKQRRRHRRILERRATNFHHNRPRPCRHRVRNPRTISEW
jgi:hypothetical protein